MLRKNDIFEIDLTPTVKNTFFKDSKKLHHQEKICSAPQLQQLSPPLEKRHFYRGGQVNFKNDILTEHGKQKKICFLRSMGSTFSSFATPPQWNDNFFFAIYTAEGCKKLKNHILTEHGKQKKMCFIRSMGSIFLIFATPLESYAFFFDHEVAPNSDQSSWEGVYIYKE